MAHYNRLAAVQYAAFYWERICHDGRVATSIGYPTQVHGVALKPGMLFSDIGAIDGEADCTHFLSCCVGNGTGSYRFVIELPGLPSEQIAFFNGGGLHIPSPFSAAGVYGQTWTPQLVADLKRLGAKVVGREFMPKQYADGDIKNLEPGDVLAYASKDDPLKYEHICLIVARGLIACHTHSRFRQPYTSVYFPWVTLLKMP